MKHIDKKLAINKVLSEMKWKKVDMATSGTNCQSLEDNYRDGSGNLNNSYK